MIVSRWLSEAGGTWSRGPCCDKQVHGFHNTRATTVATDSAESQRPARSWHNNHQTHQRLEFADTAHSPHQHVIRGDDVLSASVFTACYACPEPSGMKPNGGNIPPQMHRGS
eukprot:5552975-Amphidinium_carterae.1